MSKITFYVEPGYERMLAALDLDSLEKVLSFRGEQIKDQRGRRDVLRVKTTCEDGSPVTLFIKRMTRSYLKDGLATRIRHGRVISKAGIEFENTRRVIAAGINASPPVAYGEDCGAVRERASVIITEATMGTPLDEWLAACNSTAQRRALLRELGGWIRLVHDRGISFPDFFARHVFVTDRSEFSLIDLARVDWREGPQFKTKRARDLAALQASVPLRALSTSDRVRMLCAYANLKSERRELVKLIAQRMKTLLRRRKFAGFSQRAATNRI